MSAWVARRLQLLMLAAAGCFLVGLLAVSSVHRRAAEERLAAVEMRMRRMGRAEAPEAAGGIWRGTSRPEVRAACGRRRRLGFARLGRAKYAVCVVCVGNGK